MKLPKLASRPLALSYRTDSLVDNRSFHVRCRPHVARNSRILIPVDCDERAKKLLKAVSAFAGKLGADLILLHVYEEMEYAPAHTTSAQLRELNTALRQAAEERLAEFQAEFGEDSAVRDAQTLVACGHLQEEVLEAARSFGADLILVSTHAYSRLRHLFLGSKAESILHHASCPVMVVPRVA